MNEEVLAGGDVNVVVRVGDTVRRPTARWSPAVHALLRHFESAGFDGAPRFLGIDDRGREILGYVEGVAALPPVPADDEAVVELARLVRRMHDAQAGFVHPGPWFTPDETGPVICFRDFFPPNVIFRDGRPVALIDWDLAGPGERALDVAALAAWWSPLRPDDEAAQYGFPISRRGPRMRAICDAYGLEDRGDLIDRLIAMRARRLRAPPTAGRARATARLAGDVGCRQRRDGPRWNPLAGGQPRGARAVALKPITVLVSACGAPGTAALMRALRENGEREVRIVGTDMGELAIGRHLADAFHRVPAGSDAGFADAMLEVCRSRAGRRRAAAVVVRPARSGRGEGALRGHRRARLLSGGDPPLERQGRDLRAARPDRRPRAGLATGFGRRGGRCGRPRARLPRASTSA